MGRWGKGRGVAGDKASYSVKRGMWLVVMGLIPAFAGLAGVLLFLRRVTGPRQRMGSSTIIQELVLPHFLMIVGLGVALFGLVVLVRARVVRSRSEPSEP
jgi:hypothetical protein